MTDEIRITRRVALPDKYEFYEIQWKGVNTDGIIPWIEEKVSEIRELLGRPRPEISPKILEETIEQGDFMADLIKAGIDPSIIAFTDNTAKLKSYQKDKTVWERIHFVLKEAGYKWIADGKDSRWER